MNEFDKTTRNIIIVLSVFSIILIIFGFFVRDTSFLNGAFGEVSFLVYTYGVLFGIAFSIIKVLLIRFSLVKVLTKSKNRATMTSLGHFIFRYLLTGLMLYISIKSNSLDFFGALLGILALQPASYFSGYLLKRDSKTKEAYLNAQKQIDN